jgi:hypothetical protein
MSQIDQIQQSVPGARVASVRCYVAVDQFVMCNRHSSFVGVPKWREASTLTSCDPHLVQVSVCLPVIHAPCAHVVHDVGHKSVSLSLSFLHGLRVNERKESRGKEKEEREKANTRCMDFSFRPAWYCMFAASRTAVYVSCSRERSES